MTTGCDHENSEAVVQAAQWLSEQQVSPSPVVPALRQRFNLSPVEACEAIKLGQDYRTVRRAIN